MRGFLECPKCGVATKHVVVDSRRCPDNRIRRRRTCGNCGERFTTHEKIHTEAQVLADRRRFNRVRDLEAALAAMTALVQPEPEPEEE